MSQLTDDAKALLDAANKIVEARTSLARAETEFASALHASSAAPKAKTEDHWSNYVEYNKSIRAWFVSFGIGAPALFLINTGLLTGLKESEFGYCIVVLFLIGCGVQVALAVLNKLISWHLYCGEQDEAFKRRWRYKAADFANTFLIDTAADVLSLACFGLAIYLVLQINFKDLGPVVSSTMPP